MTMFDADRPAQAHPVAREDYSLPTDDTDVIDLREADDREVLGLDDDDYEWSPR